MIQVEPGPAAQQVTVRLCGELDYFTADRLRQAVAAQLERGADVVTLELSDLSFVDSSGLGAMVWVHKTSRRYGATVALHAPGRSLRMLLRLTGLDTVLVVAGPAES